MERPEPTCLCELCDCGRHKHHKDCKLKHTSVTLGYEDTPCRLTHYQSTFIQPHNVRIRSSKRPLRTPFHPNPPAMQFETTNRREFVAQKQQPQRVQPFMQREKHKPPKEPFAGQTAYNQDFPSKELQEVKVTRPRTHVQVPAASVRFCDSTTNKEMFRGPPGGPQSRYGELPAIVGCLLYPDQKEAMMTTTQREFVKKMGSKPELIKAVPGTLKNEGDQDMRTIHQITFKPLPLEKARVIGRPKPSENEPLIRGGHMETVTKYRADYPIQEYLPEKSRPAYPPADNLAINHSFHGDFKTEQREVFRGWDTRKHKRPAPARLKEELSEWERGGHFDGDTVTKLAFQSMPVALTESINRPRTALRVANGKFDDTTANKIFYSNWGVQPHVRHGDLYDGTYVRPLGSFERQTTNRCQFYQKHGEMVPSCKPQDKPVEAQGEHDFTTVHKETYRPISLPPCQLEIFMKQKQQLKENVPA
ncbi:stabilizer of axonemal microtubules 1 [Erpetoichthys calabaricus]|uniref:stabilizer of axonemal microtubules 1 n=1 Tax=Erpetoichthys calabaricus TaxID=27687 RepID=UPI0022344723|nr:stabilizer of axonemal microtubules 1 [Erpetoichthys calabaricus]